MKVTHYILIALAVLLVLTSLHIRALNANLANEQEHVRQAKQDLAQCSAALGSATRTAAALGEQGKQSQENCASAILAAQSLHMLALPPTIFPVELAVVDANTPAAPVNSPPREVNDAAFTQFLNTF